MRTILTVIIFSMIAFIGCDNQSSSSQETDGSTSKNIGLNNFVVVWQILTDDHEYVMKYLPKQAKEFDDLFEKGTIENAYLNNFEYVELNNDAALATVVFIIKAKSLVAAQGLIDQMSFVRNKVATYNLYPVGASWLGRKAIANENLTFSFATIWFNVSDEETTKTFTERQTVEVLDLWREGVIENAYFAADNAFEQKDAIPGMMFFVNADTEEEAREICDSFIFSKEGIATYTMHPVGTFWQGTAK